MTRCFVKDSPKHKQDIPPVIEIQINLEDSQENPPIVEANLSVDPGLIRDKIWSQLRLVKTQGRWGR